jgi:hypothetical protein
MGCVDGKMLMCDWGVGEFEAAEPQVASGGFITLRVSICRGSGCLSEFHSLVVRAVVARSTQFCFLQGILEVTVFSSLLFRAFGKKLITFCLLLAFFSYFHLNFNIEYGLVVFSSEYQQHLGLIFCSRFPFVFLCRVPCVTVKKSVYTSTAVNCHL